MRLSMSPKPKGGLIGNDGRAYEWHQVEDIESEEGE